MKQLGGFERQQELLGVKICQLSPLKKNSGLDCEVG